MQVSSSCGKMSSSIENKQDFIFPESTTGNGEEICQRPGEHKEMHQGDNFDS